MSERVAIVGSRDYPRLTDVEDYMRALPTETLIVTGGARGVDLYAEHFARDRGMPLAILPAHWGVHGRSAGYRRNEWVVRLADRVVAFWDGKSKGAKHTIDIARRAGKPVEVITP